MMKVTQPKFAMLKNVWKVGTTTLNTSFNFRGKG